MDPAQSQIFHCQIYTCREGYDSVILSFDATHEVAKELIRLYQIDVSDAKLRRVIFREIDESELRTLEGLLADRRVAIAAEKEAQTLRSVVSSKLKTHWGL